MTTMTNLNALADILLNAGNQIKELMNESPAEWPYKDGDYIYIKSPEFDAEWILKFKSKLGKEINDYWAYNIKDNQILIEPGLWGMILSSDTHRYCTPDEIALAKSYLPDGHPDKEQPKQLPSTIEEIVEVIKPVYGNDVEAEVFEHDGHFIGLFPTRSAAEQSQAHCNVRNIVEWANKEFGDDGDKWVVWIEKDDFNNVDIHNVRSSSIYHMLWQLMPFTSRKSVEYVISKPELLIHFKKLFTENK